MPGKVTVYGTSVSSDMETKKNQQRIEMVLSSKKIEFEFVDISVSSEKKDKMREIAGDSSALPPQIANGEQYCGDYAAFDEAVEMETLNEFLKL